ncbi:MAG: phosphoribosylaminoimidazolesuccinocarboxamide synthase [Gemmatimonadetes bacterium]|nr:phosphoribosylaminoimidazolesuccinocarboxamide synthase [Gemmatimonadota bacterium]
MTPLSVRPTKSGKVRDLYDLGDRMILVTTDRISAFDAILPSLVPGKGIVLNTLTKFWMGRFRHLVPNHILSDDPLEYPAPFRDAGEELRGRSVLVRKAEVFPFECVVRAFLTGSGWKDYVKSGAVSGVELPPGLALSERLAKPIFTPTTKSEEGHDIPVSFEEMKKSLGDEAVRLRDLSLELFETASAIAAERGILIADTKFEFGRIDGTITLIDEVLTPDSSRFWKADRYEPGKRQESYDKQYVREYLLSQQFEGEGAPPKLPDEVVARTAALYREILTILTGDAQALEETGEQQS